MALCAAAVALAGCGGGGGGHASGPPASLPLPGAPPVQVSALTSAATQLCAIVAQSHQSPGTVLQPFYAGPHNALHLLAAVAHAQHPAQADQLLQVMVTYEQAIADHPPPPQTGADADALQQAVGAALTALGVPPPSC